MCVTNTLKSGKEIDNEKVLEGYFRIIDFLNSNHDHYQLNVYNNGINFYVLYVINIYFFIE